MRCVAAVVACRYDVLTHAPPKWLTGMLALVVCVASASAAAESGSGTKFIYMSTAQVYASQTKKAAPVRMPTVCVRHHVLARARRCLVLPTLASRT